MREKWDKIMLARWCWCSPVHESFAVGLALTVGYSRGSHCHHWPQMHCIVVTGLVVVFSIADKHSSSCTSSVSEFQSQAFIWLLVRLKKNSAESNLRSKSKFGLDATPDLGDGTAWSSMFVAQGGVLVDVFVSILYACHNILHLHYLIYILMEPDFFIFDG